MKFCFHNGISGSDILEISVDVSGNRYKGGEAEIGQYIGKVRSKAGKYTFKWESVRDLMKV